MLLGAALLVLLWFAANWGIHAYVSSRIEAHNGQPVPQFSLRDQAGRVWTTADLRQGKTTVLNFFRSACSGCLKEREAVFALHQSADQSRLQVLGVMLDQVQGFSAETTQRTLARFAYRHPVLMADRAFVDAFHGVGWAHVTPVTYVVDGTGRIVRALRGHQTLAALQAAVR